MRVALLTDGIWPFVIGGMQKHSYYMCKFLAQAGIHVDLYHTAKDISALDLSRCFSAEELLFIRSFTVPFPKQDKLPGHYIRASLNYSKELCTLLRENRYGDIVYAKGLTSWSIFTDKLHDDRNAPVCINVHGYEYFQKSAGLKQKVEQWVLRRVFRRINNKADYIYSYGGGITQIIKNQFRESTGKIIEIPGGISEELIVTEPSAVVYPRKFVFVGRFERRKGISELHQVLKRISGHLKFEFHFIGAIPAHLRVLDNKIIYHGEIADFNHLQRIARNCDVLVCPSYAEGMPNVVMEGMASGCAIIGTDVGAMNILVDETNGWLTSPGSRPDLMAAIVEAIEMPADHLMNMKHSSVRKIRRHEWKDVAGDLVSSFRQILDRHSADGHTR